MSIRFEHAAVGTIATLVVSATAFVLGQLSEASAPVETVQPMVIVVPADSVVRTEPLSDPGSGIVEINK